MVRVFILLATVVFFSCNTGAPKKEAETKMDSAATPATENRIDVSMIQFASTKDPVCGMPISAGISDTLTVDSKTYGFCSPECKDEYAKLIVSH